MYHPPRVAVLLVAVAVPQLPAAERLNVLVIGRSIQFAHVRYAEWASAQECELDDHDQDPGEHRDLAKETAQARMLVPA